MAMGTTDNILLVDDDPHILAAYRRSLRKQFAIEVAGSGQEGLAMLRERGPFAVVVSDMRMPQMDGIQFLIKVREVAPTVVRMMLTGNADQQTAIDAINEGNIFRFLNKPCSNDLFARALEAGLEQHRLIMAEKVLLEKTLKGILRVLAEVLSMVNPTAFGRSTRARDIVSRMSKHLTLEAPWRLEVAALLSQIGCVTVPENVLARQRQGESLTEAEWRMITQQARLGGNLISSIPRLEEVARIIACQNEPVSRQVGLNAADLEPLSVEVAVLRLALDYDKLTERGMDPARALAELRRHEDQYDGDLLDILERVLEVASHVELREVMLSELKPGMIVDEDVRSESRLLLIARGQKVSHSLLQRVQNFASVGNGIREPIRVLLAGAAGEAKADPPTAGIGGR